MQCAAALLPSPAFPQVWAQSYHVRGRGSPSKSHFLENPRNSGHGFCSARKHTKNVPFYHRHPGETLGFVRLQSRKWGQRIQGHQVGRNSWNHSPPSTWSTTTRIQTFPATFNYMILVLFFMLQGCNSLLSTWECLHGKQGERRTKHFIPRPWLLTWTSTSNTSELWDSTGGESVLSQLLISREKGAVVQRKWSQQSPGGGERAPSQAGALLVAPLWLCRSPFFCTHKRISANHWKVPRGRACC